MPSRLGEKPCEETLESEEEKKNWEWELDSKTRNGNCESKWKLNKIVVEEMWARAWVQGLIMVRGGGELGRCMGLGSGSEGCAEECNEVSHPDNDCRQCQKRENWAGTGNCNAGPASVELTAEWVLLCRFYLHITRSKNSVTRHKKAPEVLVYIVNSLNHP